MTYEKWKQLWRIGSTGERIGQAFVNQFLPGDSPLIRKIYYLEDYWEADTLISQWLMDHCYYPNVPEVNKP